MSWIKQKYSKGQVNRAGNILRSDKDLSIEEIPWALEVLNNWRSAHSYPINTFQATLRQKLKRLGINTALVAQRLKRIPSIVIKLQRIPKMNLSRMQDIGGLRAVVQSLKEVETLRTSYYRSKFDHKLVREDDYISEPKASGYRGVHLIYAYNSLKLPDYNGLQLELQIRTKQQHAWATAVETTGAILNEPLKASEGSSQWLEFFALAGSAFAYLEGAPLVPRYAGLSKKETFSAVIESEKRLNACSMLGTLSVTMSAMHDQRMYSNCHFFLLVLDIENRRIQARGFGKGDLELASKEYLLEEQKLADGRNAQVVLVSADSIGAVKKAYPNYFLNTQEFVRYLRRVIDTTDK